MPTVFVVCHTIPGDEFADVTVFSNRKAALQHTAGIILDEISNRCLDKADGSLDRHFTIVKHIKGGDLEQALSLWQTTSNGHFLTVDPREPLSSPRQSLTSITKRAKDMIAAEEEEEEEEEDLG